MTGLHKVLAAVIERDGKVLIGRRPTHKDLGGLWEFPGGKLEPGETLKDAAIRELAEELGVEVTGVGRTLAEIAEATGRFLICFVEVRIADDVEPAALEHQELAWVSRDQLEGVDLAPTDAAFAATLTGATGP